MAQAYFPLLVFVVISIVFAFIAIGLPSILGPRRKNAQKQEPYESGIIPFHDARRRFPVKYYLVAMLFILFDIEVIFLFPWAGALLQLRDEFSVWIALAPMGVFLLILVLGLAYEWSKGALDWE
ncbi:MAG: NADH-quinone oxidoreductase subunit A [Caldilinea sp.]|nr:NADH-quinone oxidoreductase subunit A [Anaerolineales bacterium]HRA69131.1 NADH-quinone oxidoreductase subunit A [Caldilinea sp.]